ncbi:MAG: NAD(P)-dependent oxidoreductase [Candidatus Moraniibacteriota bacterium]
MSANMENSKVFRVLILGSKGMLGQALLEEFRELSGYAVTAWDKEEIDLTDFGVLEEALRKQNPNIVINAAAYNAVDDCEEDTREFEKAVVLNAKLPENLAQFSSKFGFFLVHYSTDYVFDGTLEVGQASGGCQSGACCGGNCHGSDNAGYDEEALPHPLSKYGETKLAGEGFVRGQTQNYYIIRLSKLFGRPGTSTVAKHSFFEVMLDKGKRGEVIKVVDGEKSCFTYAPDLARATRTLLEDACPSGIYHLPNEGGATWYEATQALFGLAGLTLPIEPISPEAFSRKAKRPIFSVLLNTQRPLLRPYTEALRDYLGEMVQ